MIMTLIRSSKMSSRTGLVLCVAGVVLGVALSVALVVAQPSGMVVTPISDPNS